LTLNKLKHVSSPSHNIQFYTRALRHIRPALTESMASTLGVHLWYNPGWTTPATLCMECQHPTCTNYNLSKILSLMWFCLLFIRHLSASEQLSYLNWLPVYYRIQFKIATLTYKTLATCQPSYLYSLLQVHQPSRALRSSTQKLLQVPFLSTDFGRRAVSYSSLATWNSIPTSIKNCSPYTVSSATSNLTS